MSVKQFRKHLQKDEGYADTVWTIILSSVLVLSVVFIGVVGKEEKPQSNPYEGSIKLVVSIIQKNEGKRFDVADNTNAGSSRFQSSGLAEDTNGDGMLHIMISDKDSENTAKTLPVVAPENATLELKEVRTGVWSVKVSWNELFTSKSKTVISHYEGCEKVDPESSECEKGWYPTPLDELFTK